MKANTRSRTMLRPRSARSAASGRLGRPREVRLSGSIFDCLCSLARFSHDEVGLCPFDHLLDAGVLVAGHDEEAERIRSDTLVGGNGDDQSFLALCVVAFADDPEFGLFAAEKVDTLLHTLVVCFVSGLVLG